MRVILPAKRNVVDSENHLDSLSSELDGAGAHQKGLEDVLLGDVTVDAAALDADAGVALAHLVAVPQLGDDLDAVEPSVLGEGGGDHLEGCLLYTSPSPRDRQKSRMPSSA